nr:hypothetical protein [Bacillus sp. FJAT-27231]
MFLTILLVKQAIGRASKLNEGQIWLKRVSAEMGGEDTNPNGFNGKLLVEACA